MGHGVVVRDVGLVRGGGAVRGPRWLVEQGVPGGAGGGAVGLRPNVTGHVGQS